jgi:hypothetical protein
MYSLMSIVTPILADVGDAFGYLQSQEFLTWFDSVLGGLLSNVATQIISTGFGLFFSLPSIILDFVLGSQLLTDFLGGGG